MSDKFGRRNIEHMYQKLIRPFYDKHISLKRLSHHPTKLLFELLQSYGCQQFELERMSEITGGMRCRCSFCSPNSLSFTF